MKDDLPQISLHGYTIVLNAQYVTLKYMDVYPLYSFGITCLMYNPTHDVSYLKLVKHILMDYYSLTEAEVVELFKWVRNLLHVEPSVVKRKTLQEGHELVYDVNFNCVTVYARNGSPYQLKCDFLQDFPTTSPGLFRLHKKVLRELCNFSDPDIDLTFDWIRECLGVEVSE